MYKHILFATDLTDDTEFLTTKVRAIRGYTGAKLTLIHVVEPLPGYSYAYLGIEDIEGQLVSEAKQSIVKLGEQLAVDQSSQLIEVGPTKVKILAAAEQVGADLIVCGSHGRHGLSLLLGSTANAVLHAMPCDILTIKTEE